MALKKFNPSKIIKQIEELETLIHDNIRQTKGFIRDLNFYRELITKDRYTFSPDQLDFNTLCINEAFEDCDYYKHLPKVYEERYSRDDIDILDPDFIIPKLEESIIEYVLNNYSLKYEVESSKLGLFIYENFGMGFPINAEEINKGIEIILKNWELKDEHYRILKTYYRNSQQTPEQLIKDGMITRLPLLPSLKYHESKKYHIYSLIFAFNHHGLMFDLAPERIKYIINVSNVKIVEKILSEIEKDRNIIVRRKYNEKEKCIVKEYLLCNIDELPGINLYNGNEVFYIPYIHENIVDRNMSLLEHMILSIIIEHEAIKKPLIVSKEWFLNFTSVDIREIQKIIKKIRTSNTRTVLNTGEFDYITEKTYEKHTHYYHLTNEAQEVFKKYL